MLERLVWVAAMQFISPSTEYARRQLPFARGRTARVGLRGNTRRQNRTEALSIRYTQLPERFRLTVRRSKHGRHSQHACVAVMPALHSRASWLGERSEGWTLGSAMVCLFLPLLAARIAFHAFDILNIAASQCSGLRSPVIPLTFAIEASRFRLLMVALTKCVSHVALPPAASHFAFAAYTSPQHHWEIRVPYNLP